MIRNLLSDITFVDRVGYLCELARGKKVLHLGATDSPGTKVAAQQGQLLHFQLSKVSEQLIGMDLDHEMIQWLSDHHQAVNIKCGDVESFEDYPQGDFDVIIAGEILEHLNNPGKALDCLRTIAQSSTKLVITVPNTYSFKGYVRAVLGYELIHPDHILHHSPHTLKVLLERHGFAVENFFSYVNGGSGLFASTANQFIRLNPRLAEGIGVVCTPSAS